MFSGALIFTATLLAVAASHAQDAPAALVEAAKKEGRVVWYTSFASPRSHESVTKSFENKYGVKVDLLNLRGSETEERIRTEQATGRFLADVLQVGEASAQRLKEIGFTQPHGGVPNAARMIEGHAASETHVGSIINAFGMTVNANLVTPAQAPTSWRDLLAPQWKGRILSDDMRAAGVGFSLFCALMDAPGFGADFHRALAKQDIVFTRDVGQSERRVARGEYAIWIPQHSGNVSGLAGLPIKVIAPREGVAYTRLDLAMVKGAPHPNAARLFMNYYLSEDVQLAVSSFGGIPVIKGVVDKLPAGKVLETAKLMGTTLYETQERYLALANEIYR